MFVSITGQGSISLYVVARQQSHTGPLDIMKVWHFRCKQREPHTFICTQTHL